MNNTQMKSRKRSRCMKNPQKLVRQGSNQCNSLNSLDTPRLILKPLRKLPRELIWQFGFFKLVTLIYAYFESCLSSAIIDNTKQATTTFHYCSNVYFLSGSTLLTGSSLICMYRLRANDKKSYKVD